MKNPFSSARIFCTEMLDELKKATWPTRTELRDSTIIVIVAAVILGVFTSISDLALGQVVDLLTSFVS
jgi:preprotein translocase subunit SecE